MKNFAANYPQITSAIHTFVATFVVTVLGLVAVIPADAILSGKTWGLAAIVSIITAGVRAGIKAVSPLA
jgi:hypothetical protein